MIRRLYTLSIPSSGVEMNPRSVDQRKLVEAGLLDEDAVDVQSLTPGPNTIQVDGVLRGNNADQMRREIEELAAASGFGTVPYFGVDRSLPEDGYYSVSSRDATRQHPGYAELQSYSLRLTKTGTRRSHFRTVSTAITDTDNPFGTQTSAYVGVHWDAERVRWFDPKSQETYSASVSKRNEAEYGTLNVYDANDAPIADPDLIFDLPYDLEGLVDATVWDDYNQSKYNSNDNLQWAQEFRTDHDDVGNIVLDNGLIRLTADTSNNVLGVEQYDEGSGSWADTSLGTSDWALDEWEIREISPVRVVSVTEFYDTGTGATYSLRAIMRRGVHNIQFDTTGLESGSIPSGLYDLLDPIASGDTPDPGGVQVLTPRTEVSG